MLLCVTVNIYKFIEHFFQHSQAKYQACKYNNNLILQGPCIIL